MKGKSKFLAVLSSLLVCIFTFFGGGFQCAAATAPAIQSKVVLDWGNCAFKTQDGGFLVLTKNAVNRYDSNGSKTKSTGVSNLNFTSLVSTNDGNYIAVGDDGNEALTMKISAGGDILWQKTYGANNISILDAILQISDGNYVTVGKTSGGAAAIGKLDANGNPIWVKFSGSGNFSSVLPVSGGYMAFGTSGLPPSTKATVAKFSDNGDLIFQSSSDSPNHLGYNFAAETPDHSFLATTFGPSLLHVDANGNMSVLKTYDNDDLQNIQKLSDGNFIVAGADISALHQNNILMEIDASGNILWQKSYGCDSEDYFLNQQLTNNGSCLWAFSDSMNATGDFAGLDMTFNQNMVAVSFPLATQKTGSSASGNSKSSSSKSGTSSIAFDSSVSDLTSGLLSTSAVPEKEITIMAKKIGTGYAASVTKDDMSHADPNGTVNLRFEDMTIAVPAAVISANLKTSKSVTFSVSGLNSVTRKHLKKALNAKDVILNTFSLNVSDLAGSPGFGEKVRVYITLPTNRKPFKEIDLGGFDASSSKLQSIAIDTNQTTGSVSFNTDHPGIFCVYGVSSPAAKPSPLLPVTISAAALASCAAAAVTILLFRKKRKSKI